MPPGSPRLYESLQQRATTTIDKVFWSWPSGWCIGLRSWLRGFDAQLGHLHDACTSLLQKPKLQLSGLK